MARAEGGNCYVWVWQLICLGVATVEGGKCYVSGWLESRVATVTSWSGNFTEANVTGVATVTSRG